MWRLRPDFPVEGHLLSNIPPSLTKISHIYHSQVQVHFKANFVSLMQKMEEKAYTQAEAFFLLVFWNL